MAFGNNMQGGAPQENPQVAKEKTSNLSETAQFVKPYLDIVTQLMRDMGLVEKANKVEVKILLGKFVDSDPEVVDFKIACRDAEAKAIATVREKNGDDPKGEAVVRNYYSKFIASLG